MKIRIDDSHRRTASPRADQLLSRFLLAVVATPLHRLPRVRTGRNAATSAALRRRSIISLRGRPPGKNPAAPEVNRQSYQSASKI